MESAEGGVDGGHVLLASIAASALIVVLVWVGLHANRAEDAARARGRGAPVWVILAALGIVGGVWVLYRFRDASPLMEAFSSAMLGGFVGAFWAFVILRWLARLSAGRTAGRKGSR